MTAVVLPPGVTWPRPAQGVVALTARNAALRRLRRRYGPAFTVDLPLLGRALVVTDPDQVKQVFTSPPEVLDTPEQSALGRVLGPHSLFALQGEEHRRQRKLLVPPFHGRRLGSYEPIVEEETRRELASWPAGREVAALPSMMRITLNVILRAVFGARDAELDRLREVMPRAVELGSRIAFLPRPPRSLGPLDPWARLAALRREFDGIVERLVAAAPADPDRTDVLSLLARTRHEDGSPMTPAEISDHLLTLLTAGHETTATTLAWAVERLRRHPAVLDRLTAEVDAGGSELLAEPTTGRGERWHFRGIAYAPGRGGRVVARPR